MWVDGGYPDPRNGVSVELAGVDVGYIDFNGLWMDFVEARDWTDVVVTFDLTGLTDKSDALFYLEPYSGMNGSCTYMVGFDNILRAEVGVKACLTTTANLPPNAPVLYNTGGGLQIFFNNARIDDDTPTFRVSANDPESEGLDYWIQIDDDPGFGGVDWSQFFTNGGAHYSSGATVELTCAALAGIANGTTYYVRVAAKDPTGSDSYGDWSTDGATGTWSFTYKTSGDAEWHQTKDEQFETDALVDAEIHGTPDHDVGLITAGEITTYDFVGVTQAGGPHDAYACDVDVFPFDGDVDNRNTMVEATDALYDSISFSEDERWETATSGNGDENFMWFEINGIAEDPAVDISQIDLTFEGYLNDEGSDFIIYVLIAGTYTPICLTVLRDTVGWYLFALVWALAIIGISLKMSFLFLNVS